MDEAKKLIEGQPDAAYVVHTFDAQSNGKVILKLICELVFRVSTNTGNKMEFKHILEIYWNSFYYTGSLFYHSYRSERMLHAAVLVIMLLIFSNKIAFWVVSELQMVHPLQAVVGDVMKGIWCAPICWFTWKPCRIWCWASKLRVFLELILHWVSLSWIGGHQHFFDEELHCQV